MFDRATITLGIGPHSSFTRFTDMMGPKIFKNGSCDHDHAHLGIVYNPETKLDILSVYGI